MSDTLPTPPSVIIIPENLANKVYALTYSSSTVSSILIECPEHAHVDASPLIVANECDDTFETMCDFIIDAVKSNQCVMYKIAPWDVSGILAEAGIEHTYDTLGAMDLLAAFNANRTRFIHLSSLSK